MRRTCIIGLSAFVCVIILTASLTCAQEDGNIQPVAGEDTGLPPGATREGEYVLHPIASELENLHLLAGFYYSNPREWKRIYRDNKSIIRNPNRLPVGQTLRIHVGSSWKPRFTYEKWFELANRNGQWASGTQWKRARETTVSAAPSSAQPPATAPAKAPEPTPQPAVAPEEPTTQSQPVEQPQDAPPAEEPAEEQTPPPAEEEAPPSEEAPQEEAAGEEEQAPAF